LILINKNRVADKNKSILLQMPFIKKKSMKIAKLPRITLAFLKVL